MTKRFVIDENFPEAIVPMVNAMLGGAALVDLDTVSGGLRGKDDWELFVALHGHPDIEGLITCDAEMLGQAKEMSVLTQTGLSLVVATRAGHNPVRATGLVLTHIDAIARETRRGKAQVWVLSASTKIGQKPWQFLKRIAQRTGADVRQLYQAHKDPTVSLRGPTRRRRDGG